MINLSYSNQLSYRYFKLKNVPFQMVVVLMFVRIPWSKVKVSRAHAKGHPVLLIRTAVLSNAVSFHYFHNIIPPTVNIKLIAKTRNIFCRIFQIFLIASTRWNQNFKNLLNEIRIDITLREKIFSYSYWKIVIL